MTKEDKQLLLQDLCSRLPYGVICDIYNDTCTIKEKLLIGGIARFADDTICLRPYLRSISSMTEEEVDHLFHILKVNEENGKEWIKVNDIGIIRLFTEEGKDFYEIAKAMDYLHSIHIDYRGLIPKGLAIAVTKENNPYEN